MRHIESPFLLNFPVCSTYFMRLEAATVCKVKCSAPGLLILIRAREPPSETLTLLNFLIYLLNLSIVNYTECVKGYMKHFFHEWKLQYMKPNKYMLAYPISPTTKQPYDKRIYISSILFQQKFYKSGCLQNRST